MIKFNKIFYSRFDLDLAFQRSRFPFKGLVALDLKISKIVDN